jgi:hypothetical protein
MSDYLIDPAIYRHKENGEAKRREIKANREFYDKTFTNETPEPVPNLITIEEIKATLRKNNPKSEHVENFILNGKSYPVSKSDNSEDVYKMLNYNISERPPFSVTRELVIDKIMEEINRPHCSHCKLSFNKANDGSVYVELYKIQDVTYV